MGGLSLASIVNPASAIGTVGAAALGGGLGYLGAKDTNESNERIASARNLFEEKEAEKARGFSSSEAQILRNFSSAEALKQMDFQDRMSSTAVSRRMADMKKAGINPILAGKYDASTPAGAMGSGAQPATAKANSQGYTAINKIQPLIDNLATAIQLRKLNAEATGAEHDAKIKSQLQQVGELPSKVGSDASRIFSTFKNMLQDKGFHSYLVEQGKQSLIDLGTSTAKTLGNYTDQVTKAINKYTNIRWSNENNKGYIGPINIRK